MTIEYHIVNVIKTAQNQEKLKPFKIFIHVTLFIYLFNDSVSVLLVDFVF